MAARMLLYDESRAGRVIYAMYVYRGAGLCLWCVSVVIVRGPRAKRKKFSAKRAKFSRFRVSAQTREISRREQTRETSEACKSILPTHACGNK